MFLDYPLYSLVNEAESNLADIEKLAEAIAKLPLPSHFSFDEDSMVLSYEVPLNGDGLVCDLGWLKEQIELILKYAEALLRAS